MHTPVLLQETLSYLAPQQGQTFVDCTLGLGGHAKQILKKIGTHGRLIGFEHDPRNRVLAEENLQEFSENVTILPQNFVHFREALTEIGISEIDGVLLDLGISSLHLDEADRGFSFRLDGPLDMRMDLTSSNPSAAEILNSWPEEDLQKIFQDYGEVEKSYFYAKRIAEKRREKPFVTTFDLAHFLEDISPKKLRKGGGNTSTLIFQALRIAVNKELDVLTCTLPQILPFLKKGARIVAISFHSLEDRIIKNFFRTNSVHNKAQKYPQEATKVDFHSPLKVLTKKGILPTRKEVEENPRARSARMRVAEKII